MAKTLEHKKKPAEPAEVSDDFTLKAKQGLLPLFFKEAQLGRALREKSIESREEFRRLLFFSVFELVNKVDDSSLVNGDIRKGISDLASKAELAIGHVQKVVNIYLKYYCILSDKKDILKELDCPIDPGIAGAVWNGLSQEDKHDLENILDIPQTDEPGMNISHTHYSKITELKTMDLNVYEFLQGQIEKMGDGTRLKPCVEIHDQKKIRDFLAVKSSQPTDGPATI